MLEEWKFTLDSLGYDLFFFLDYTEASNYADDTDLYTCDINLENLIYRLEHDAHISIEWFEYNYMKLNEDNFLMSGNKNERIWECWTT